MHEMSIVESLIEQVEQEIDRNGHTGQIVQLDLTIGRFSGVHPESIRFAFEVLAPDTRLASARLQIREPSARCVCRACNAQEEVNEIVLACPACGSSDIKIEGGQDLTLDSIELEDD